jgi:hypothetical protein
MDPRLRKLERMRENMNDGKLIARSTATLAGATLSRYGHQRRRAVDLVAESPSLDEALEMTPGVFGHHWILAGRPRDVLLDIDVAEELRAYFEATDFQPLDSDTFQLPYLRLHIRR